MFSRNWMEKGKQTEQGRIKKSFVHNSVFMYMDFNNMIRDPTGKNQSSVFRFESYPEQTQPYPWDLNMQQAKYPVPSTSLQVYQPGFTNYVPTPQALPAAAGTSSFVFGSLSSNSTLASSFCSSRLSDGFSDRTPRFGLGKRKIEVPSFEPRKQHITEEKMAEHMSRLHISSETATSILEPDSIRNKRLYMCEEMRKLQTEPLLPTSLLAQMEQPCKALVLWQPPTKILPILSSTDSNDDKEAQSTDENELQPDMDLVDMDKPFEGSMELDT